MKSFGYKSLLMVIALTSITLGCKKNEDPAPQPTNTETVQIGGLFSLTGNWSSLGITSKAAMELAIEDVNLRFRKDGTPIRFEGTIFDTKLESTEALKYIAEAKQKNIRFIIGPQSSAEAGAVKSYADDNDILVVSQGSTAGNLAIAGDNLFRFCPADNVEGAAMAKTIYNDGIRAIVTIARDDAGNLGLQNATGNSFTAQGGKVSALAAYSATTSDFNSVKQEIRSAIHQLDATYSRSNIAVYLASFDEIVDLFGTAASDSILSSVRWYGSDGVALSAALINNSTAAEFAIKTQYFAPTFGLADASKSKWEPLATKIATQTGIEPDAFALAVYDAIWVIAQTYQSADSDNFDQLKSAFKIAADQYNGVTGTTKLNEAGDRATGTFDYWGITKNQDGSYKWTLIGESL